METSVVPAHPKPVTEDRRVASSHWRWCAPYLASGRVRISRNGGRTYPRSTERAVTEHLPEAPSALRIYDQGYTRVFVADFDSKSAGAQMVARQARDFLELVHRAGGLTLTDISPNGGRHVYVPLATPAPWALCRRIAAALADRYSTFDKAPMSGQTDGLIRPPGSPHPAGGWQELTTDYATATRALSVRTSADAFDRFARSAGIDPHAPVPELSPVGGDAWFEASTAPALARNRRRLPPEWTAMATTGQRPASWPSDSEARLALLRACARHGWLFSDVAGRFESGEWPGLTALYARYAEHHVRRALAKDWLAALSPRRFDRTSSNSGEPPARNSDTRVPPTHPLGEDIGGLAQVRQWWTVVRQLEKNRWPGRYGLSIRRVLRAIASAAWRTGSTVVGFGVRSLAEGSGLDHSTVAEVLRTLRGEDAPILVRVQDAAGVDADLYELVVPAVHEDLKELRWRAGTIRSVHPVFRSVGGAGFLVWEVLAEAGSDPVTSMDVAVEAGIPLRTVQETLVRLSELGLVQRRGEGWVPVGSDAEGWTPARTLDQVALELGADIEHQSIMAEHRRDRIAWQSRFGRRHLSVVPPLEDAPQDRYVYDDPDWTEIDRLSREWAALTDEPGEAVSAEQMVEQMLGGSRIDAATRNGSVSGVTSASQ